jgi:outer membrane immunogenic protein
LAQARDDGFVGGGQVGYNYQIGSFAVGLEADIQWAHLGSNGTATANFALPAGFATAGTAGGIDWFGTVRARAGVALGQALVYATGGFAFGGADDDNNFGFVNDDDVRTGWALGGGVEWALPVTLFGSSAVTFGVEGLWVNLDEDDEDRTFIGYTATVDPVFVARAKLNVKCGIY